MAKPLNAMYLNSRLNTLGRRGGGVDVCRYLGLTALKDCRLELDVVLLGML
ncbi:MAG: hypothetical protein HOP02_14410 [Methylococcaceae bacterium]|nr:hypothetical protein [Methylococcaceae bacterium]